MAAWELLCFTSLGAVIIPHMALGSELSSDYHVRSRLYGARHAFFVLGSILSLAAMFVFI